MLFLIFVSGLATEYQLVIKQHANDKKPQFLKVPQNSVDAVRIFICKNKNKEIVPYGVFYLVKMKNDSFSKIQKSWGDVTETCLAAGALSEKDTGEITRIIFQ